MIKRYDALKIVLDNSVEQSVESINIEYSTGRVLAESIIADRDFPPYDRVCMDGIAILYESYSKGSRTFPSEHLQTAGSPEYSLKDPQKCVEVMTGAILPSNTTTVIPYESLTRSGDTFTICEEAGDNKNIHYQGSDCNSGTLLLDQKKIITTAEIGVLATIGKKNVQVVKLPKVAIISTGDELVGIDKVPEKHQIRRSNAYSLLSVLKSRKINPEIFHINDKKEEIRERMAKILSEYDVVMLSGGVSKGKLDFLPEVLEELSVRKLFHRIQQRPGKPFWFGRKDDTTIFAFPGNPVSTIVCCLAYFLPWLDSSLGIYNADKRLKVKLADDVSFTPDLHYFAPCSLIFEDELKGKVIKGNGSGDLSNLMLTDGFIELPQGRNEFTSGEYFNFIPYRPIL